MGQARVARGLDTRDIVERAGATSVPRPCPSLRARPRFSAQRPLPSGMIATWRGMLAESSLPIASQILRISASLDVIAWSIFDVYSSVRSWIFF